MHVSLPFVSTWGLYCDGMGAGQSTYMKLCASGLASPAALLHRMRGCLFVMNKKGETLRLRTATAAIHADFEFATMEQITYPKQDMQIVRHIRRIGILDM